MIAVNIIKSIGFKIFRVGVIERIIKERRFVTKEHTSTILINAFYHSAKNHLKRIECSLFAPFTCVYFTIASNVTFNFANNIKHGFDVMVREMTWEPLSKQAQVDKFIKLYELDGGETMRISDLAELDPGGPTGKIIVRRMKAREAEMAQAPAEPQVDPAMQAAPPLPPMPVPVAQPVQGEF